MLRKVRSCNVKCSASVSQAKLFVLQTGECTKSRRLAGKGKDTV